MLSKLTLKGAFVKMVVVVVGSLIAFGLEAWWQNTLPNVDVAAAGGWKNTVSLTTAYQQADSETILKVVLEAGELREVR